VEAEFKKKKGGKGLSVLSGRDLFEYKRELFKDDVDADDTMNIAPAAELIEEEIKEVAEKVQSDLFLNGDDDDLDDLDDDDAEDVDGEGAQVL